MAEERFVSVCSVEEFILEQENRNAAQKTERDVRLLERILKTKVKERKMKVIPFNKWKLLNEYWIHQPIYHLRPH